MDLKGMLDRAKRIFEKPGGAAAAKGDVAEFRHNAHRDESQADKADGAVEAVQEPDGN